MTPTLLWIFATLLVAIGLLGLVLPVLPGAPILFAGLLLGAWADDFAYVGAQTLIVLGVVALLTYGVDFAATALGAKRVGASNRAIWGAVLGGLVGVIFGLPGLLLGPFVGAVAGELSAQRDLKAAGRAGLGASIGLALGAAAKLALGFGMIGVFLLARFA
ncbi:MAG: DUF456 domain-containing protein [Nitrospirota bacterium]